MKERGLTQAALARLLGHRHEGAVSRLMAGKHGPKESTLQRLADALQTPLTVPARTFEPTPAKRPAKASRSAS